MLTLYRIAYHEAGHAVIAAHLHVPFSHVWITTKRCVRDKEAGATETTWKYRSRRAFSMCQNSEGETVLVRVDMEKKRREVAEREIMMMCAGRLAEQLFYTDDLQTDEHDVKAIHALQGDFGISDARVARLRRRVERLVQRPRIKAAIQETVLHLMTAEDGVVPAKTVRAIYQWPSGFEPNYRASHGASQKQTKTTCP